MVAQFSEFNVFEEPITPISRSSTPELTPDFSEDDDSVPSTSGPPTSRPSLIPLLHSLDNAIAQLNLFLSNQADELTFGDTTLSSNGSPESPLGQIYCEAKEVNRPRNRTHINRNIKPPVFLLPDRFIPTRVFTDQPSVSFHVGHDPEQLSPEERVFRHRSEREDPFMTAQSRRQVQTPRTSLVRLHATYRAPHLISDAVTVSLIGPRHPDSSRRVSSGGIWQVGGTYAASGRHPTIPSGIDLVLASRAAAPVYSANFLPQVTSVEEQRKRETEKHEARLALALDIDRSRRLLNNTKVWPVFECVSRPAWQNHERFSPLIWKDNAWRRAGQDHWTAREAIDGDKTKKVPSRPFRILDAPYLRDDFYCSTLAYSPVAGILAVGLANRVYLWSDVYGVQYPPLREHHSSNYVSALSFSSENGGKSILAIGRQTGILSLWSTFDQKERFEVFHPHCITCVAFKQSKTRRLSERVHNVEVDTEDLAVGDDLGYIWYYSVEWCDEESRGESDWKGSMTLIAKISAHAQQICGIVWSPDGIYLATGGNDNTCLIFELPNIIPSEKFWGPSNNGNRTQRPSSIHSEPGQECHSQRYLLFPTLRNRTRSELTTIPSPLIVQTGTIISGRSRTIEVPGNCQKHRLEHMAAVKALAFAPWQPSLLATGGGSNDRAIHFYHTPSGACLATINVHAQVTSLIWSKTRREIVATFGFAQPEHPFRIAVFAWPSCEQISAIPWGPRGSSWSSGLSNDSMRDCGRALCAVSYPCRPSIFVADQFESNDDSSTPNSAASPGRRVASNTSSGQMSVEPRAKEGGMWCSRTVEEGCIIVASSDQTVKFHEVWSNSRRSATSALGPYGGSEILEGLEGLEKTGNEIIR